MTVAVEITSTRNALIYLDDELVAECGIVSGRMVDTHSELAGALKGRANRAQCWRAATTMVAQCWRSDFTELEVSF